MQPVTIFIDGDACPVKDEIYTIAWRHKVPAIVVSNAYFRVPNDPLISQIVVSDHFDAADDYIADHCHGASVVITADILLAERCLSNKAIVLSPKGVAFTENSIGSAVATRSIMADLRAGGEQLGGPAPFQKKDRSQFLSSLHEAVEKLKRNHG